jgi:hypothetical protein
MDLYSLTEDLCPPPAEVGIPVAGKRARVSLPGFSIDFLLYLPADWQADSTYPVIVEYPGNGPYLNELGDTCTGRMEDCVLGYGISRGQGIVWACLPFVTNDLKNHQLEWWGDVEMTVEYCKQAVCQICTSFGGDRNRVFLAGFSRGAIACNFIGLHNDEIASIWRGFVCHSHYDGVYPWSYPGSDRDSAVRRLHRLGERSQWISHEASGVNSDGKIESRALEDARSWLSIVFPDGAFTFRTLPFPNHTARWVLRDLADRDALRKWLEALI